MLGFANDSLFVRTHNNSFTVFLVYVDDVILAGNDTKQIQELKNFLSNWFKLKRAWELEIFPGHRGCPLNKQLN